MRKSVSVLCVASMLLAGIATATPVYAANPDHSGSAMHSGTMNGGGMMGMMSMMAQMNRMMKSCDKMMQSGMHGHHGSSHRYM